MENNICGFKILLSASIFLILFFPIQIFAQRIVMLNDSTNSYPIGKYTYVFRTRRNDLTIDSVANGKASGKFIKLNSIESNYSFTADIIWVRFTTLNNTADISNWLISEDYSIIDTVIFYIPVEKGKFNEMTLGTAFPMKERAIQSRLIVFPFHLNPSEQKTFFLKFHSNSDLPVYLRIWKRFAFYDNEANKNLFFGVFYGALIIMAFYNLFLFYSVKDSSYLYYFLYALAIGYYQFCMDGLRYQFIFPNNVFAVNLDIASSIWIMGIFWMLFVRQFLQIYRYSKSLEKFYKITIGIFISLFILTLIFPVRFFYMLTAPLWIVPIFINVVAGIYSLKRGDTNARIYLIATFIFILGAFLRVTRVIGVEQTSWLSESVLQIGIIIEMTLLSFALGNRINTIKQNEEREKALIRSRIASDLHDEIGSNLSSISLSSQMIKNSNDLNENDKKQLEDITATAKETAESIKDIIWFINPDHDNPEDFVTRMRDTASKMLQGIQYTFDACECKSISNKDLQFRRNFSLIYKEILHNIVKHSKASLIDITIKEEPNRLSLKVTDNGIGFDEKNVNPLHGEGIKNLKRRANEIDGTLNITSRAGKGTSVFLRVKI